MFLLMMNRLWFILYFTLTSPMCGAGFHSDLILCHVAMKLLHMTSQAHNMILSASQKTAKKRNGVFICFVMVVVSSYS